MPNKHPDSRVSQCHQKEKGDGISKLIKERGAIYKTSVQKEYLKKIKSLTTKLGKQ